MNPSHSMAPRPSYPSLGQCVFCLKEQGTENEHIVPLGLTGSWVIENAACQTCERESNQLYENAALQSDMLRVPRKLLDLKRRNAKKKPPLTFPKAYPGSTYDLASASHLEKFEVGSENYPQLLTMLVIEAAGKLADANAVTGPARTKLHIWIRDLDRGKLGRGDISDETIMPDFGDGSNLIFVTDYKGPPPYSIRQIYAVKPFALMLAKIAYCFAVAERGLHGFDGSEMRQLLKGKRDDVYNFVGSTLKIEDYLTDRYLHHLAFRQRGNLLVVIVHLFSSYGAPPYEVVVGKI